MLTQKRVKELFEYKEDGNLIRRIATNNGAKVGDITGCPDSKGYLRTQIDGHLYGNHRLVWLWHHGYLPENGVDHKDRIKINNWIDNLREVGQQCNLRNTGNRRDNTSGVKGVHWHSRDKKWLASVVINQKDIHLGYHSDFTEAVAHRLAAEQAEFWEGCDSSSPAFQYMQEYINCNA